MRSEPCTGRGRIQAKEKSRISRLDGGGGRINAFIIKIGQYYFVEFGETGDACYGYSKTTYPLAGAGLFGLFGSFKTSSVFGRDRWEQKFVDGSDTYQGFRI